MSSTLGLAQSWLVTAQSCLLKNYTFNPVLDKAILFVVGNTLVCDDLQEAKHLNCMIVVVTIDGILLTKAGNMTDGISGGMEAMSHKWDDKKIEGLNKKKEGFEAELQELGSTREMRIKESEAYGKISELKIKIQFAEIEKPVNDFTVILQIKNKISSRQPKILLLERRINEVVDETYKTFSESVGVENIREYEDNQQAAQKLAEESLSLRNQQSKLNYQLKYEEKRDMGAHITKMESSLNELINAMGKVDMLEKELKSTI
nr:structural maintenance of chromosomes protein 1 [Tanacetum cinerariifolium]